MWTHEDILGLLPHIIVRASYKDGVLSMYSLYPEDGYVLHIPILDENIYDEDDNIVDTRPYYTYGGATVSLDYDFVANPRGYNAVLYEEGMIVYGDVPTKPEIM